MEDQLLYVILIAKRNTSLSFIRALQSILKQAYSPIKILVVDANEPDSLYSFGLQEDLTAFPEAGYLRLDQSFSVSAIRNFILDYVEGDYVAFLSSNDVWDPSKALLQMEQLKANPDAAASCCNGILMDERRAEMTAEPLIERLSFAPSQWLLDNPAKMPAQVIYRMEALRKEGGFDERYVNFGDGDMLLRLSKKSRVLLLPVSLCECHIIPDHEDYDLHNFRDGQNILYKYLELFLQDKQMTQRFYAQMIHMAGINYLWLNYFAYCCLYFIKGPGHSILLLFRKTGKALWYVLQWIRREFSQVKEDIRIGWNLYRIRTGKQHGIKAPRPNPGGRYAGEEPIVFASSRQFNGKRDLDFIFSRRLKSIVIPKHVTVIKKNMFYGCDQLVSVEIPDSVLEIEAHAFHRCRNLRHVIFREGCRLAKIGAYAFAGCSALEAMSLPSGVAGIGSFAFAGCVSLKQLFFTYLHHGEERSEGIFPTAIATLSRYTFAGCANLASVEFGAGSILNTVENGVFLGCGKLRKVVLTGGVKALGSYAFAYCRELENIAIPQIDGLKKIGTGAFLHCEALDYFQLPNQMEHIQMRTFYGCSGLKLVKIPKKVRSINHQAFVKCTSLTNAMILSEDVSISPTAFDKHTQVQILGNGNTGISSAN